MASFTDLDRHLAVLRDVVGVDPSPGEVGERMLVLADERVRTVISETTAAIRLLEGLRIAASGVAAARSRRERGHAGLAGGTGHRNAVALVQELTGGSRAEAVRQVRLGEAILEGVGAPGRGMGGRPVEGARVIASDAQAVSAAEDSALRPWHAVLGDRLLAGALSPAQHHAILRGLGDPPVDRGSANAGGGEVGERDAEERDAEFAQMWALAAEQLADEARERSVEELGATARTIRDRLDPAGAEARHLARHEARSFRMWVDGDGVQRASVVFDDEMAAWVRSVVDGALRPRRGGPRFVDPAERKHGEELVDDPRTNDQLAYDLLMDTLRAGSLADAASVFGTRQAGVRIVVTAADLAASEAGAASIAHTEDGAVALPAWVAAQRICESGTRTIVIDADGEPLRLGRDQRLFSPGQRVALAVRDGGCRWRGCDRVASMCEAHHIDPHSRGGATDVDRGILLCRFHHMNLHHSGSRITRDGMGDFVLHPPPGRGAPITLAPRRSVASAWSGAPPPQRRSRPAA